MKKKIIVALMCVVCVSMSTGTVSAKTVATYKTNPFVQEAKEYLENADSDDRYANYSVGELAEKLEESKGWMDKLSKFCKPVTEEKVREQGLDPDNLPLAADLAPYLNVANNITGNKTAKTFCSDPKEALKSLTLVPQKILDNGIQNDFYGTATPYVQEDSDELNCYAYAVDFDFWACPGCQYFEGGAPYDNDTTVQEAAAWVLLDLAKAYHKPARTILSRNSIIGKDERRICMRIGHFYLEYEGEQYEVSDFHFMRQVNNGGWAQKHGSWKSQYDGFINPSEDSNWILFEDQYYNSKTVYIAM